MIKQCGINNVVSSKFELNKHNKLLLFQLLFVTEIHATVTVHVLQLEILILAVVVMLDILDPPVLVSAVVNFFFGVGGGSFYFILL